MLDDMTIGAFKLKYTIYYIIQGSLGEFHLIIILRVRISFDFPLILPFLFTRLVIFGCFGYAAEYFLKFRTVIV